MARDIREFTRDFTRELLVKAEKKLRFLQKTWRDVFIQKLSEYHKSSPAKCFHESAIEEVWGKFESYILVCYSKFLDNLEIFLNRVDEEFAKESEITIDDIIHRNQYKRAMMENEIQMFTETEDEERKAFLEIETYGFMMRYLASTQEDEQ
jgi:hypothetical protein